MSGDVDPRDHDARERDDGIHDRAEEWLVLGQGPGSTALRDEPADSHTRDRDDDGRGERDRELRDREDDRADLDARGVFMHHLDLPRGHERERVRDRGREYALRGADTRTLSTVGAFRIVAERDLRDSRDSCDVRDGDLRQLKDQGLIERVSLDGRDHAVVLTDRGRDFLERHRSDRGRDADRRQAFHRGTDKPRERSHDAQIYRAYLRAAERLQQGDARILRVELDRELKAEYQRFLQERNSGDRTSDGRPNRGQDEIERWAHDHDLPYFDGQVHVPDLRIVYRDRDDEIRHEDLEVTTEHYRGRHGAAAARSGFSLFRGSSQGAGGSSFDPRVAEDFL